MIGWIKIEVNEQVFSAVREELDRIEPHEHFEGMNECTKCDEHVLNAVLRHLKQIPTVKGAYMIHEPVPEYKTRSDGKTITFANDDKCMAAENVKVTKVLNPEDLRVPVEAQEPVAWVEVLDSYLGPYNFHCVKSLLKGKHNLYAHPPKCAQCEELEDLLKTRDQCSFMGAMRDCPTHGESAKIKELQAKLAKADAVIEECRVFLRQYFRSLGLSAEPLTTIKQYQKGE